MIFHPRNNKRARSFATILLAMVVLAVSAIPFVSTRAAAPVNAISYQGRLLNSNGVPVADASLEFVFRFFDSASGGTCLWESDDGTACDAIDETQTVALTDGLFSENIGSSVDPTGLSEAYPADLNGVFEDATNVYLEVVVDGETLSPRKQMVATPYALNAQSLDGLDSTDFVAATGDTVTGIFDFIGAIFSGGSPLVFEGGTADPYETTFAITDPLADRTITFQDADGIVAFTSNIPAGASLWETSAFGSFEDDNDVVIGTSGDETIFDGGFSLDGDNLFVSGNAGIEGTLYADGGITLADGLGTGELSVEGNILDVDSFTFASAGTITTTAAGSDLSISAADAVIINSGASLDIRDTIQNTTGDVVIGDELTPDGNNTRALGSGTLGWSAVYLRNPDDSVTVSLSADGSGETNSGASVIGVFDEFGNSTGGNVQDVLDDLDLAIASGGVGSMWTLSGGVAYLTGATNDLSVGGTTAAASPFGVDESTNTIYIGEGSGGNGTLSFKASDSDAGSMAYSTNDRWEFSGGDVFIGASALGAVKASFSPNGDDLYVAGDIAAQTSVYADSFIAGDASTTFADGSVSTTGQDFATNISVSGADALSHTMSFQIDGNAGLTIAATGDGAGGVGARTIQMGVSAAADIVTLGDANADVSIGDAQWSISSSGGAILASLDTAGSITLQNDETISNGTDDVIALSGTGGGDNTNLLVNLDGTRPVISSDDSLIGFADNLEIDPASGNASIDFYASDADTGTLAFTTADAFDFSGGNIMHMGNSTFPTTLNGISSSLATSSSYSGTSAINLGDIEIDGLVSTVTNSASEGGGGPATQHLVYGSMGSAWNSGVTGQVQNLIGAYGSATNNSTNASAIGGYISGAKGAGVQNSIGITVPDLRGITGSVRVDAGTVTDMFAVRGDFEAGAGTATTGYGGYFTNANEGDTRYGILAAASGGGTANYAAYLHSAAVHIETSATPSSASIATGAGDLFVDGQLEVGGDGITSGNISVINSGTLTTGIALIVQRSTNAGSDFTNTTTGLVDFTITDTGSTGNILTLVNEGTGISLLADPNADTGNTVTDTTGGAVHVANSGNADYGLTVYTDNASSDNSLAYFFNDNAGFDNYVVDIRSDAASISTVNGSALHILQDDIDMPGANSAGTQALVIDTNENFPDLADGVLSDAMILVREDVGSTPDTVFRVEGDGDVWADGTLGTPAVDVAETYPSTDALVSGELVVIDPSGTGVLRSTIPYQSTILGGVSTMPGILLGSEDEGIRIGLSGRIPTFVTDENGPIAAGDAITSSSTPGYGMKATEPGMIVGFALEDFTDPGSGTISLFINPQFYVGGVISTDGSVMQIEDDVEITGSLSVLGSGGSSARQMTLVTDVTEATDYRLSIENAEGTQVAYVSNEGDLALAGRFYPSDRGALQTSKYIYYDGSSGMGGDFMRTNASGWATGSYDFAEMFPSTDTLEPGDVVVFGTSNESVARSTESFDSKLAGIVSTRPGFLAGDNVKGQYPIALAGRVPTKVTNENGSIGIGDPITSSSRAGYAMKATEAGPIVGYALEPYDGGNGDEIVAFVNVSYWNGGETPALPGTNNAASTIVVTQYANNLTALNMNGNVYMTGNDILGVRRIAGLSERWSIEEDGTVRTPGLLKTITESYQGENVETAAVTSPDVQITLVGTGTLENGEAVIRFEDVSPSFNDVTSTVAPIRVIVTPNGPLSLYVFEKDNDGFGVRQADGRDSGVTFDWMVSAYRKGYEPEEEVGEDGEVEEEVATEIVEVMSDEPVVDDPVVDEEIVPGPEIEAEPVVMDETAIPESPEPTPDDSMESTVVDEPAPQTP